MIISEKYNCCEEPYPDKLQFYLQPDQLEFDFETLFQIAAAYQMENFEWSLCKQQLIVKQYFF